MTLRKGVSEPFSQAQQEPHPGLLIVEWFARNLGQPYSQASVLARLPSNPDIADRALLVRALETVGLRSKLAQRDLRRLDPIVLPCVVFTKDGARPIILKTISSDRKTVQIVHFAESPSEQEMPLSQLRRLADGKVMLITPEGNRAESLLSPETRAAGQEYRHWFWTPFWANWKIWVQVFLAVFVLNILSVALPLFVMHAMDTFDRCHHRHGPRLDAADFTKWNVGNHRQTGRRQSCNFDISSSPEHPHP
jgi:ABC-type bacteriocin/lantibiotic exporter with double-glycine peptidase domain